MTGWAAFFPEIHQVLALAGKNQYGAGDPPLAA